MTEHKKPIILCIGLPGTGKSTTGKLLEEHLTERYLLIDTPDSVDANNYVEGTYYGENRFTFDHDFLHMPLKLGIYDGVIQVQIAPRRDIRQRFYDWARSEGGLPIVLYHICPKDVAHERIKDKYPGSFVKTKSGLHIHSVLSQSGLEAYNHFQNSFEKEDPKDDVREDNGLSLFVYDSNARTIVPIQVSKDRSIQRTCSELVKVIESHTFSDVKPNGASLVIKRKPDEHRPFEEVKAEMRYKAELLEYIAGDEDDFDE